MVSCRRNFVPGGTYFSRWRSPTGARHAGRKRGCASCRGSVIAAKRIDSRSSPLSSCRIVRTAYGSIQWSMAISRGQSIGRTRRFTGTCAKDSFLPRRLTQLPQLPVICAD